MRVAPAAFPCLLALALALAPAARPEMVPTDPRFGPLRLALHRVETVIDNQVATTRVTQVFRNENDVNLEAIYVFPTPAEATLIDFAMTIDGKVMRGELLERDRARRTYEKIVARAKDPGLLEQIGKNVFRMRVFPVTAHSEQRVELTYVERVPYENGRCTWRFPLRTPGSAVVTTADDLDVSVRIRSAIPIRSVQGIGRRFEVSTVADGPVVASLRQSAAPLDADLELAYDLAREESGFDVIAHRTTGDGTFLLLLTPALDAGAEAMPKDMTFVFDTSGSMQGEKLAQAKAALRFCVGALAAEDRFRIVRFSDSVELFRPEPLAATAENRVAANRWIDRLEAVGSTNIDDALQLALAHQSPRGRPHMIVFLTDGLPTAGEKDPREIVKRALARNQAETRIFAFGVGDDVNRGLLEDLADGTRAISCFVAPGQDLEAPVSTLQRRIAAPVIAGIELDWGGADVHSVYPKRIPDLYAGVQMMVVGRYGKAGTARVTLRGKHGTREVVLARDVTFPESRAQSDAIPYLWGARRIADLLDTIRRDGENAEIVADVVRLSREYRVATPYTSFLVLESESAYDREGIDRKDGDAPLRDQAMHDPSIVDHNEAEDFVSDRPLGATAAFDALGVGGGAAGRFGSRSAGAGGSARTEASSLSSLNWLARHQNADGSWGAHPCGSPHAAAIPGDAAHTGLSLLGFLGVGYTHLSKETYRDRVTGQEMNFGRTVKEGLRWLIKNQGADGSLAGDPGAARRIETHAIATTALSEAFGLTNSPLFKEPAQKAIDFLVTALPDASDPAALAWAVLAVKSAEFAGLIVPAEALRQLEALAPKVEGVEWLARAVRLSCGTLLRLDRATLETDARAALAAPLPADPLAAYLTFLALHNLHGWGAGTPDASWSAWIRPACQALLEGQVHTTDACELGSWPGADRMVTTGLRTLALEAYYRYVDVLGNRHR